MSRHLSGLRAWVWQRLSAVYMVLYVVYFVISMNMIEGPLSFVIWREWLSDSLPAVASSLFYLALLIHAWVGVRDILIDYVHQPVLRAAMLGGLALLLIGCVLWVLKIIMMVSL